jgi:hypothetical protein
VLVPRHVFLTLVSKVRALPITELCSAWTGFGLTQKYLTYLKILSTDNLLPVLLAGKCSTIVVVTNALTYNIVVSMTTAQLLLYGHIGRRFLKIRSTFFEGDDRNFKFLHFYST